MYMENCLLMYQMQRSEKTQFFLNYELRTPRTEGPVTHDILLLSLSYYYFC